MLTKQQFDKLLLSTLFVRRTNGELMDKQTVLDIYDLWSEHRYAEMYEEIRIFGGTSLKPIMLEEILEEFDLHREEAAA